MVSVATAAQPAQPVDWAHMRALFVKGLSLAELARQTGVPLGTIKARSHREKWATTVAEADRHINRLATERLAESATRWLDKIDGAVHASLDNVIGKGLGKLGLKDLQIALDCAEKANRIARQNYGLDAGNAASPRVQVQVQVLTQAAQSLSAFDSDVIDLEPVKQIEADAPASVAPGAQA